MEHTETGLAYVGNDDGVVSMVYEDMKIYCTHCKKITKHTRKEYWICSECGKG